MSLKYADRVKETAAFANSNTVTLLGATIGHRSFSATLNNADQCYYSIENTLSGEWETGLATYQAPNTLTLVKHSGNSALISSSIGEKEIFIALTAAGLTEIGAVKTYSAVILANGTLAYSTPNTLTASLVSTGRYRLNLMTYDSVLTPMSIAMSCVVIPNGDLAVPLIGQAAMSSDGIGNIVTRFVDIRFKDTSGAYVSTSFQAIISGTITNV